MRTGEITLSIESDFDNVFLAGLAINRIASWSSMSEQAAFEMELAVVEAVNNAVEHAHHHQRDKPILVHVQLYSDYLKVVVIDRGVPIDFEAAVARGIENASDIERGRGLKLIYDLMDEVKYERKEDTNRIILVKYI